MSEFAPSTRLVDRLHGLVRGRLWLQILVGMALGIGTGIALSGALGGELDREQVALLSCWLALPGHVFLALIQMMVIPLVVSSVALGIASSGSPAFLKRVGLILAPYFLATTTIAVLIGIGLAMAIQPGALVDSSLLDGLESAVELPTESAAADEKLLPERIVELIPSNPADSILRSSLLQIVVMAILIGAALVSMAEDSRRLIVRALETIQELAMKIVSWAMALAPVAVFGLLAQVLARTGLDALFGLAAYVGTVLLGLLLLIGVYLILISSLGRSHPGRFLRKAREVQLLAFSTSSSAAVMPLSMQVAEDQLGVSKRVSQFVIPLGATVNMDGTALYQVIAAVFISQVFGLELGTGEFALLAFTTVGASIGSPSTPGVGIVILATVLQGIGVPIEGVAMILGVDRILDMCRTAVNVTGDLTAAVVLNRLLPGDEGPNAGEPETPRPAPLP